jgi:hypothetical protein
MSKFLQNLLVQISKALVYSKINFYSENNSPRHFRPTQPFGPIFFFFYRPIFLPSPTGPRPHGRPSRPARRWRPTELPPPPQEDASSCATFALSSRPVSDGPHRSSLTSGPPELGRATTTSRRSPRRPALPRMPPELLPPHHHFPLLNPPS